MMLVSKRGRLLYFKNSLNFSTKYVFCFFFFFRFFSLFLIYNRKFISTFYRFFKISLMRSLGLGVHILLVGVYFRVKFVKKKRLLEFLLGRASFFIYFIPKTISVRIKRKKRTLFLFSFDRQKLGDVLQELVSLKFMDVYHGKGFRYAVRVIKLKKMKLRR